MNDRDCENCKHKVNGACNVWDCEFEPCEPVRNPDQLDCISRQAVLEQINCWIGSGEYRHTNATDYLCKRIKAISSVNPQKPVCPSAGIDCEDCPAYEPKTGHWIFDEILDRHYYCSECKSMGVDYWDYCPNCGAKMTEEDKA